MSLQKLQVVLSSTFAGDWSNLNRAADDIKKFEANVTQAGLALAAVSATAVLFGRTAVLNAAQLDGLNRSMQAIEGSAEGASKRIKVLNEIAKLPGLNFKDAVQGDVNLRSAGLSADLAAKSMTAFGNALGILGKSGALSNVNAQIQQMANKTQGFGVDLKILKEWVPQVGVALQNAFGTQSADDIAKMGKTGKEVIEVLVAELAKLPKATGGIGNALENAGDAWFKFTGRIGLAIDKAVDLSGIFNKISEGLDSLATWFENLDPAIQKVIIGFGGILAVAPPMLLFLGALPSVFGAIGSASTLLFAGPVGVAFKTVIAAMGAATIAADIYANGWSSFWDRLKIKAEGTAIEIGIILRKLELGLLNAMNFAGSTDAAIARKERELLGIDHDKNAHVSLGNNQFNRKAGADKPASITPPRISLGSSDEGEKTRAFIEGLKLKREDEIADRALIASTEALRKAMANLNNEKLKITQTPIPNILPTDLASKMEISLGGAVTKMDKLMEQMRSNFKKRSAELKEAIDQMYTDILNSSINKGIQDMAGGMAEWVGAFSVGVKSFADLGSLLKGIFGDLMITTGKQMLSIAISTEAFKKALAGLSGAAIPISLGLIAAGSALKASASKSSGTNYQAIPQNSVSNYQPIYTPYPTQQGGNTQAARISIEINQGQQILRGSDIYQTQNNYQYDNGRF